MKILVVGLGSMGKRRVRNLLACGLPAVDIMGLDLREDRTADVRQKYGIRCHEKLDAIDLDEVDAFVISTPPDMHLRYAKMAAENNKHMFIEASVLDEGLKDLQELVTQRNLVAFPSCTMRFFAGPKRLHEIIHGGEIGRVLAWQFQSGQYLPDWHPWESVTDFYVSNLETGGCREIVPFEMVWLTSLFGPVKDVESRRAKQSDMPTKIDDIYMLQMEHESGVLGQLIVDVVGRSAVRDIRITGSEGTIEWNDEFKQIRVFKVADGEWFEESVGAGTVEDRYINPEEPYVEEIQTYLNCIRYNIRPNYSLNDDIDILRILYKAEKAHDDGKRVAV